MAMVPEIVRKPSSQVEKMTPQLRDVILLQDMIPSAAFHCSISLGSKKAFVAKLVCHNMQKGSFLDNDANNESQ